MKKRIAILSAMLLMTGCTGNVTSPGSQPSQSSQISQTSQSEQSGTAPKESTPERPLEASLVFLGDIPNNGISFTDADGNVKYCAVDMSGMDGSLILWEITVI